MADDLQHDELAAWLRRHGATWEARDPEAAALLFTPEAEPGRCSTFRDWQHSPER